MCVHIHCAYPRPHWDICPALSGLCSREMHQCRRVCVFFWWLVWCALCREANCVSFGPLWLSAAAREKLVCVGVRPGHVIDTMNEWKTWPLSSGCTSFHRCTCCWPTSLMAPLLNLTSALILNFNLWPQANALWPILPFLYTTARKWPETFSFAVIHLYGHPPMQSAICMVIFPCNRPSVWSSFHAFCHLYGHPSMQSSICMVIHPCRCPEFVTAMSWGKQLHLHSFSVDQEWHINELIWFGYYPLYQARLWANIHLWSHRLHAFSALNILTGAKYNVSFPQFKF